MTKHFVRESFDGDGAERTGAELSAVIEHGLNGGPFDRRLVIQAAPAGLDSTTPSGAAFLVNEQSTQSVSEKIQGTSRLIPRCTPQPITTKAGKLTLPAINETSRQNGSRYGGFSLSWVDEAAQLPTSQPKFGALNFYPKVLGGVVYATNELLNDAPAFGAWFERAAAREIAFDVEDSIVNGSGVGRPLGILSCAATLEVTPESGQSSGSFRFENAAKMAGRFWSGSYSSPGAAWLMNSDVFAQAVTEQTNLGAPLITFEGGIRRMLGWPVEVGEYTAELGSRGDVILADLGENIICERDNSVVQSIHVKWLTDESALRVIARVDGHPAWSSPVTPKSGQATQSPFVVLGAR